MGIREVGKTTPIDEAQQEAAIQAVQAGAQIAATDGTGRAAIRIEGHPLHEALQDAKSAGVPGGRSIQTIQETLNQTSNQ